jgi:hypothetical protein
MEHAAGPLGSSDRLLRDQVCQPPVDAIASGCLTARGARVTLKSDGVLLERVGDLGDLPLRNREAEYD